TYRQVAERVGLSRPTIYRKIRLGEFPKPIRVSDYRVGFLEEEIEAWISERRHERVEYSPLPRDLD
ncbi:MAG TPA: AlpA family phage regulatory protein, partial [Thiotrichales bacterium]|nr:AlpA family phage regulatory protein [Thiotrichales bacterium]